MVGWGSAPAPVGDSAWAFPSPSRWPAGDVIGVGGDSTPPTVMAAYRRGLFPMEVGEGRRMLAWWSPDPRGILPLDGLRITRSLRQSAKHYTVRFDTAFDAVIRACANPTRDRGWITEEFIDAYSELHRLGWAHSVEAFDQDGRLSGGLYGVRIHRLFAGESMFHVGRDASKVALMALVERMRDSGMTLLDVQWCTPHLASLGAIDVPRRQYLRLLQSALDPA